MTESSTPHRGIMFWPVGTGDSTTIVVDEDHVVQVDLHDMAQADLDDAVVMPVVDELAACLPKRDGRPYLAVFVLTHADQDHCRGFADLLKAVTIGELWATPAAVAGVRGRRRGDLRRRAGLPGGGRTAGPRDQGRGGPR